MKRTLFLITIPVLFVTLSVVLWWQRSQAQDDFTEGTVRLDGNVFVAAVADTPLERRVGLSGRTGMCRRCAMVFVFDQTGRHAFWMQGMQFNLDLLWVRDGRIIHIAHDVPHTDQQETYAPPEEADHVVEVRAGVAQKLGIDIGDSVEYDF